MHVTHRQGTPGAGRMVRTLVASLAGLGLACTTGCRIPVPAAPAQPTSFRYDEQIVWPATSEQPNLRFRPADDRREITQSDVTIGFEVTNPRGDESALRIHCRTPDDGEVWLPALGFTVKLRVRNGTEHILYFGGTGSRRPSALVIEDGARRGLPLFEGDWDAWKNALRGRVIALYDQQRVALAAWTQRGADALADYRKRKLGPYRAAYARFSAEISDYLNNISGSTQNAWWELRDYEEARRVQAQVRPPDEFEREARARLTTQQELQEGILSRCEAEALAQVTALEQPALLITPASWTRLRLLPGRSAEGFVLFDTGMTMSAPDEVHIQVFDLVTQVDAAGEALRREHFPFSLVRVTE